MGRKGTRDVRRIGLDSSHFFFAIFAVLCELKYPQGAIEKV
jgi:hypothetical protein